MATSNTNLVNALGAGSGIDIKSLAQSLVDAEKTPRKDRIDAKIKQEEGKISGQSAIKFALSQLRTALGALNDAREFNAVSVANSQSASFAATTTSGATTGRLSVTIDQVAQGTRLASQTFLTSTESWVYPTSLRSILLWAGFQSPSPSALRTTVRPAW